jgi:hypothetical protein
MACGTAHRMVAGGSIWLLLAYLESKLEKKKQTAKPIIGGGLGALCGTLPDLVEPALHPNHRQFFHSLLFAGVIAYGGYKLYKWRSDEEWQKWLRFGGMVAIGAYLIHLMMDGTTPKSLPLVGKL